MVEVGRSLRDVLDALVRSGEIGKDDRDVEERLGDSQLLPESTPLYLHPLVFLGACLAALLISVGIAQLLDLRWNGPQMMMAGAAYLISAYLAQRIGTTVFTDYLALALSIGGHAFVMAAIADWSSADHEGVAMFQAALALAAVLYFLMRDFLHRFLSCLLPLAIAKLMFADAGWGAWLHVLIVVCVATCAWFITRPRQLPAARPLAYACAVGLIGFVLPLSERGLWFESAELAQPWIASAICSAALLWALVYAARRLEIRTSPSAAATALAVVVGLGVTQTPGIPATLFLVVLGYASHHGQIALIALATFPVFACKYYFDLDLEFATKSAVLVGSGALLLVARVAVERCAQPGGDGP